MAEVIHHDVVDHDSGSGMSMVLGLIVLLALGVMFIFYGLPMLRGAGQSSGSTVNIPDKVDVNVTQPK